MAETSRDHATGPTTYKFPHNTCEGHWRDGPVLQPVSAAVNAASTSILLGLALFAAESTPLRLTLLSYALFEAWHTFSHVRHLPGDVQKVVVHVLGLLMSMATLAFIVLRVRAPRWPFWIGLAGLLACDLLLQTAFADRSFVLSMSSGLVLFAWVLFGSYGALPAWARARLLWILAGTVLLQLLFVNEAVNCERMQGALGERFPFHAAVEVLGLVLFVALAWTFVRVDRRR